jgi:hypothetical protein
MTQVRVPEFKPQYHQKKKKKDEDWKLFKDTVVCSLSIILSLNKGFYTELSLNKGPLDWTKKIRAFYPDFSGGLILNVTIFEHQ